jgi:4-methylaminobutanoate oxidase (formaldehyde-forming)
LGWAVKLRSDIEFRGRGAVGAQRADGVRKMLAGFACDPAVVLLGRETIYRDGERVGWLTSGGFGYTIDRSIGYGYIRNPAGVTADYVNSGTYELEVGGERVAATASLQPFYDPSNSRVKS